MRFSPAEQIASVLAFLGAAHAQRLQQQVQSYDTSREQTPT